MADPTNMELMQELHELEVAFTRQNAAILARLESIYQSCPHQVAIANGQKGWQLAQTLQEKLANHRVEVAKHIGSGALGGGVAGAIILAGRTLGWW